MIVDSYAYCPAARAVSGLFIQTPIESPDAPRMRIARAARPQEARR
jgi:hypothetical protein